MPVNAACSRLREECHEFQGSLGYRVGPCLQRATDDVNNKANKTFLILSRDTGQWVSYSPPSRIQRSASAPNPLTCPSKPHEY